MAAKFTELVIDCADTERVAAFWAQVLGYEVLDRQDGVVEIGAALGVYPTLVFAPVPEPKTVKDRIHIDVNAVGTDQATELERLLALGARHVDVGQGDDVTWIVLADPEGNEFCLLRRTVE
jgi:catechol 2,3-dioxygenase-like lactoylglutathione lyase family enzyme